MKLRLCAAAFAAAALASPSAAHHGWAGYLDSDFALTGVVESANLGGPHGSMRVRAQNGVWDVILAPPTRNRRAGLTVDAVRPGTRVTARGHRHRNPQQLEMKTERLVVGNRTFNLYPDRS